MGGKRTFPFTTVPETGCPMWHTGSAPGSIHFVAFGATKVASQPEARCMPCPRGLYNLTFIDDSIKTSHAWDHMIHSLDWTIFFETTLMMGYIVLLACRTVQDRWFINCLMRINKNVAKQFEHCRVGGRRSLPIFPCSFGMMFGSCMIKYQFQPWIQGCPNTWKARELHKMWVDAISSSGCIQ